VTVLEPGASAAVPANDNDKDLGDAWRDAQTRFGDWIEWMVARTGTLAAFALGLGVVALLVWAAVQVARRRLV
jgi:hypothetical protein